MNEVSALLFVRLYKEPEYALTLDLAQWQSVIFVLRHHQLLARYQYLFERAGIFEKLPEYVIHHLINAKILSEKQYHQVFFEAKALVNAFSFDAKHKIFLKGAAYTLSGQSAGVGRVYSDIDLLVDKSDIEDVERTLSTSGWLSEPITKYDDNYYRNWSHEIPPLRHGGRGTVLDIHHNIVPVISGRAPDMTYFIKQAEQTKEGYSVLTPAAMTLHSIVHLFFNDDVKNGFRDLLDLDLLMGENSSESYWLDLLKLAESTHFTFELKLALRYLNKILQTEIPKQVKNQLSLAESTSTKILDFIYLNALLPSHPLVANKKYSIANTMVMFRGHWLKMPIHILLYHFSCKSFRGMVEYLFGKAFFLKDDASHKQF